MLYNPKWNKPSLAGFKAWLQTQPPETAFDYEDCSQCAAAQYLNAVGHYKPNWPLENWGLNWPAAGAKVRANSLGVQPTFGMVLAQIEQDS